MTILQMPWTRRTQPRTAFVLGGGGNLGAIQVGMLRAAFERGYVPDVIVGCSVGAINAVATSADPSAAGAARLQDLWSSIPEEAILPQGRLSSLRMLHRGRSLQTNDGLRRLLERNLAFRTFEEAPVPVHVVATSLRTGRERWFSSGQVVPAILASAALPAVFPPVEMDGDLLIDGAVVDNVPIGKAVQLGAERVVVFHVGNFDRARPAPKRPIDVLVQSFSIARNHRFLREIASPPPGVELIVLPGVDPGNIRYDDFRHTRRLIQRGYDASAHFFDTSGRVAAST